MLGADKIIAFVVALIAGEPDASTFPVVAKGGADSRYPVAVAPCPRPLAPAEIEGKTIVCGTVSVPEDHAHPGNKRHELLFAVYKSHSLVPAKDAVVHLHGGPGSGIMQSVSLTTQFFDKLRQRRDIVAFDQRGVDTSGAATRCFSTISQNVEAMALATVGKAAPNLQEELTAACIAELKQRGTDLSKINTEQNALDVQAVMRALGYPQFNVYGISYGTKLGLEVMRTAPEGVRSVVLDSVAPPHVPTYDTLLLPHYEAVKATFDACAADSACANAYPDMYKRFWNLAMKLDRDPLRTAKGLLKGQAFIETVDSRNSFSAGIRGLTPYLPKIVAELEKVDTTTWDAIQAGTLPPKLSTESILAKAGTLKIGDKALVFNALKTAEQIRNLERMAEATLQVLESDIAATRSATDLAAQFDGELEAALKSLSERTDRVAFAQDYLALRPVVPAEGPLINLVSKHFKGEPRDRLISLIQLMTPKDIADTFRRIGVDNVALEQVLAGEFEMMMFACQEDMDINSLAGVERQHAALDVPEEFKKLFVARLTQVYKTCALFEQHPRPGFHDPVTSPIPTLVFGGLLDTQTAASWAPETARHLPNGRAIVFPETGHGALTFSDCAQDLGVAFIENPAAELDDSCTKGLAPHFVLPDGTMSGG